MNALQYALTNAVMMEIPRQVLEVAFPQPRTGMILSLEERMLSRCVRPLILMDMNLVGDMMIYVQLAQCNVIAISSIEMAGSTGTFIVDVPKYLTNDKTILRAYSLVLGMYGTNSTNMHCISPILVDTAKLGLAINPNNVSQTAKLSVVGENKVLVEDYARNMNGGFLKLGVENNSNLENIQPSYYPQVAKLILLGLKRYIYNNTIIDVDVGEIYAGHEIGRIKEIIDSYADATEMYNEELIRWSKLSVMNDVRKSDELLKLHIGMMA